HLRLYFLGNRRAMGIYWRNVSYRRIRTASIDLSFCCFLCRRSIRAPSDDWDHSAYLHKHLSEYWNDHRAAANYRRAIAVDQLQRLIRTDDHVWPRAREQRLDPSKNPRVTKGKNATAARGVFVTGWGRTIYFNLPLPKLGRDTWKPITRSNWRFSKGRSIYCFT